MLLFFTSRQRYVVMNFLLTVSVYAFVPAPLHKRIIRQLFMEDETETTQVPSVESIIDKKISNKILKEIEDGTRSYPSWFYDDYQEPIFEEAEDDDDPFAIDPTTLGKWDETDLEGRLEYEFDPEKDGYSPNDLDPKFEYAGAIPVDEEGVEQMYDPVFGSASPFDERTIVNPQDSYVIDDETRDDSTVTPTFNEGDIEIGHNADFKSFRKSLKIIDTYVDPYLNMEVPRHYAKWYGNPEKISYPKKPEIDNTFTKPQDKTDFSKLTPYQARKKAVEMARSKNNEWLPKGKSVEYLNQRTDIFKEKGVLTGSLIKGNIDPDMKNKIRSALDVLGSCVDLLEINELDTGTVFRFHYHGLIKNKRGMAAWTKTLIEDCGVECTGVVFETGMRKRDPYYDGGDKWYGPY